MAVRQYIGARYVPTFYQNSLNPDSTEWEPNVNYYPLTIVSLPNLHSYISKKFVPDTVGSPASNPEYWYDQGYANAYIQALQDQIGNLPDLETYNASDLVNAINSTIKKRYVFIGDSALHASGTNNGWYDRLLPLMRIDPADAYEADRGGAAFIAAPGYTFQELIESLESVIDDKESITDVVLIGGNNDVSNDLTNPTIYNNLVTAVNTFVQYAKVTYPRAKIRIGCMCANISPQFLGWRYNKVLMAYASCKDAEFFPNIQYIFHDRSLIGSDLAHPTDLGYTYLTHKIADAMNGGCSVHYMEEGAITPDTNWESTNSSYNKFTVTVNNGVTQFMIYPRIGMQSTGSSYNKSFTYGSRVKIGDTGSHLFNGVQNTNFDAYRFTQIPCYALLRRSASQIISVVHGTLEIFGTSVYFISFDQILGTSSEFQSVDQFSIFVPPATFDSMFC